MSIAMTSQMAQSLSLGRLQSAQQLSEYGALDDFAAMAVLATLTMLYLLNGTLWNKPDPYLYKMYEKPREKMTGLSASKSTREIGKKLEQTVSIADEPWLKAAD